MKNNQHFFRRLTSWNFSISSIVGQNTFAFFKHYPTSFLRYLFIFSVFGVFMANSQNPKPQNKYSKQIAQIVDSYDKSELAAIYSELSSKAALHKSQAKSYAILHNIPLRYEDADGVYFELQFIAEDGSPIYFQTFNANASISTRANYLNTGGGLGLNLNGDDLTAHVWDAGLARTTHQEYDGPGGNNRFSIGDGTTFRHYHSAHVTGTIMASGVDAAAKGMAWQGNAVGYDWNDDIVEGTTAASNGMLISNHSYGYRGDLIPDAWFGQYGEDAHDWDDIMNNAPYYLMVVAAGNDGEKNWYNGAPLEGNSGYDKLSGHATSKNNLVVANGLDANINPDGSLNSVTRNSSSSQGPTDDYRIKPDIMGNGTLVYSTYDNSDTAYNSITGTSMASPNVAGTLLLLQEHYVSLHGNFMKAASLKGLALHTADDVAMVGPDAETGWGLMNAKKAAETLSIAASGSGSAIVEELSLSQGQTYQITVESNGVDPLMASISWTDVAGAINPGTNSSIPALVNDLDIRLSDGTEYTPWKLHSVNINIKGDNVVDPYERIDIVGASGSYTLTVTHKGTLSGGVQNYTLIVTGIVAPLSGCPITTYTSSGWSDGPPDSSMAAVIDANYSTSIASIDACSLLVNAGKTLTVIDGTYVKVEGDITVDGTLFVANEGSVVQVDDNASVIKNGSINVQKITPYLAQQSFMILGSPMSAETRSGVYGNAVGSFKHITSNFFPHPDVTSQYPDAENFSDDNGDNWQNYTGICNPGEGYIVAPQPDLYSGGIYQLDYKRGTLNNGEVNFNVIYNGTQNASLNVMGNPYASAIDALEFLSENDMVNAVYFWEHLTAASASYPGYYQWNFDMGDISMFNSSGGVKAANDPGNSTQPDGYISSGQGFLFKATNAGTAKFNNAMRVTDHNDTYRRPVADRNRLWLNVSNKNYGLGSGMLINFSDESVDSYDDKYDAKRLATPLSLYSILDSGHELAIQGRSAFDENQTIPLGFVTQVRDNEEYEISITDKDGSVWPNIQVYLIDKTENTVHLLNDSNYIFKTMEGIQNERFVLMFRNRVLGISENLSQTISIVPNPTRGNLIIVSPKAIINSVDVFDVRGRKLMSVNYNSTQYALDISSLQSATYFVKINTPEGILTKRVVKH